LSDILLIGLFTYLSSGEDYEDMVIFAERHRLIVIKVNHSATINYSLFTIYTPTMVTVLPSTVSLRI
jgi:hypothetical protein